jgi:heme-degrading monooxygenase HmoA
MGVPATPWNSLQPPEPEREYVVVLTFLPVRWSRLPRFIGYVRRIQKQLDRADGLIGYSLLARPLRSRYWTLSVWQDEAAVQRFVAQSPHRDAMAELPHDLSGFKTTRWTVVGAALPPRWEDALNRG